MRPSMILSLTDREGAIPYGGSFGHGRFVETLVPIRHNLLDVDAGAEYAYGQALFCAGYTASVFHNDVTSATSTSTMTTGRRYSR